MDDDTVMRQVVHTQHLRFLVSAMHQAVGEDLYNGLAIVGIVVMESGIHAQHHVGMSCLQVVEGIASGFQLDDKRNVQLLEDEL